MTTRYGTTTLTLRPTLEVQDGIPGLFYAELSLPIPGSAAKRVNIDTGSVGFVIPNSLLIDPASNGYYPWAVPTGETMTIVYEPSGVTTSGPIVTVSGLTLAGSEGPIAIGPVKVLAHTAGADTFMMGVGFGLEAISHYGMADAPKPWTSAATVLDNPFLSIEGMSREPGAPLQAAYALSAATFDGHQGLVTFGQTEETLAGFRFVPLTADPDSPAGFQLPWVSLTVTPAGGSPQETQAQLLMDAGIENMFLSVFVPSPPAAGAASTKQSIAWPGAAVRIAAADEAGFPALDYAFVNGDPLAQPFHTTDPKQPASPTEILNAKASPQGGSFINTGVHLLAVYDYVLDAANGRLGLRLRQ